MIVSFDVGQGHETASSILGGEQIVRQFQATVRAAAGRLSDGNDFGGAEAQYVERSDAIIQRLDQLGELMESLAQRLHRKADQFEEVDSTF